MKRILFITEQLNGGGAERVLLDILRHMNYNKFDITLCQIVAGGTLADEIPQQVKQISVWDNYSLSYKLYYRLSNYFGIDWFIKRMLKQKIKDKSIYIY